MTRHVQSNKVRLSFLVYIVIFYNIDGFFNKV